MNTKNKIIALLEIAIVLCSLFLVATLPAIAAEQNQEMQEVSASTITTASEDDYVLGVYGNANEDDTIDMRDLTYVKLIFFGKKPETELADAKYDGKVNPLDFIQIKLIIVGKEKELTILQYIGYRPKIEETVTINKPIKGIVVLGGYGPEAIRVLNAADKIVGIDTGIATKELYPEISKLPTVGKWSNPDIEAIINLMPDFVLTYENTPGIEVEDKLKTANIPMVRLNFYSTIAPQSIEKLGYILDRKEHAKDYSDYVNKYFDIIESRVGGLSDDEKPKVFMEGGKYKTAPTTGTVGIACTMAGGKNIVTADMDPGTGASFSVDPEWVVDQNPDIILKKDWRNLGYRSTIDMSALKETRDEIMGRPELANVEAVKNGRVYLDGYETIYVRGFIGTIYMAKWFHPELFEDLDPKEIHQDFLEGFEGMAYKGIYVYSPLED